MEKHNLPSAGGNQVSAPQNPVKAFFTRDAVKKSFEELLKNRAPQFIASILQNAHNNKLLQKADPLTIMNAALTAAALDLPINQNLGFAYIIPYGNQAQFQMGYKGYIQLAIRSGLFKTIAAEPVREGQILKNNPLEGFEFDFTVNPAGKIIGYAAYFELVSGFKKTIYRSTEQIKAHGQRYSKSYKSGPWQTNFDEMACKTVLKEILSKYAPMSVEMQKAIVLDQTVQTQDIGEPEQVEYVDMKNEGQSTDKVAEITQRIENARNIDELLSIHNELDPRTIAEQWYGDAFFAREIELKNA